MSSKQISLSTKIFTLLCVLNPILSVYISPVPGVDLGTFVVLVFFFLCFLFNVNYFSVPRTLAVVLVYTLICTFIGLWGNLYSSEYSIILRLFRFLILLFLIMGVGFPTYFIKSFYVRYLTYASLIVAGYAILQYIVYSLTGIELLNVFGPTKQSVSNLYESVKVAYRPPSLFLEPSSAAYFLTPYLCYSLFIRNLYKCSDYLKIFIVSAGIMVTTSGQGLLVLILCWGTWLLRQFVSFKIARILPITMILIFVLYSFDFQYTISRIFTTDELNAIDARAGGYELIRKVSINNLILGHGFGNYDEDIYYSSFAEIIFCTGIIGLVLVLIMYIQCFIKGVWFQRMLVLSCFVLMAGGGIYSATFLCLYLPLLFADFHSNN